MFQCYYSRDELIVLILVVVLGAGRTTLTKIYFQMGYDDPFFVTCLVLAGHSLALPAYFACKKLGVSEDPDTGAQAACKENSLASRDPQDESEGETQVVDDPYESEVLRAATTHPIPFGSSTGLGKNSSEAVRWVHRIPFFAKPLITSVFGLMDAVFRVSSVLFLPASIADMLVTGLELFFIIVAQKLIRKRRILPQRWVGAAVVIVGLLVVTSAEFTSDTQMEVESLGLGLMCVLMKVVSGVALDMSQELFTQEASIPAIQLLGMEAIYGLILFIPLYTVAAPLTGFYPLDALQKAASSPQAVGYTIGLLCTLSIAGIFQILGTSVTSSMTRNLWITSFRGPTVWVIALIVYYAGAGYNEPSLGEEWYSPGSWMILAGVVVIFVGVRIYYSNMQKEAHSDPGLGEDDCMVISGDMDKSNQTNTTVEMDLVVSSSGALWYPPLGDIAYEIEV